MTAFEIVATEADDRTEWLQARRAGVGASDIAAILGTSPWSTPFQVWASKVHDLPEAEPSEAMRWGRLMESTILDEWLDQSGNAPEVARGALCRNLDVPIMLATPDALLSSAVVEVKNVSDWSWDEIPAHYVQQVQWQLAVTGFPMGYLVVLHGGRNLRVYEIEPDPDIHLMILAAGEFWKLVEADEPPALEIEDNTYLAALWPNSTEEAVEVDADIAETLYSARYATKMAKSRQEAAELALKEVLGTADTAVVGQKVVATWKNNGKSRRLLVKGVSLND